MVDRRTGGFVSFPEVPEHELQTVAAVQGVGIVGPERSLLSRADAAEEPLGLGVPAQPEERPAGPGAGGQDETVLRRWSPDAW